VAQGVSPKEAADRAGLTAGVEPLNASGMADEALGAAVKKTGLMDMLIEWGRKIPGLKQIIDADKDFLDTQMFKAGMDMYDQDLTQAQEKEWIKLNEHLYGYTDDEIGRLAKELTQNVELTGTGIGDTVNQKVSEGIIQRVTAKGYDEIQVRNAVQDLASYQFDLEKVADHIIERVIDRQVSAGGIDDAIKNPLKTLPVKYDSSGRPSYKVIGKAATVSINPDTGKLVTVHGTHSKTVKKLLGGDSE